MHTNFESGRGPRGDRGQYEDDNAFGSDSHERGRGSMSIPDTGMQQHGDERSRGHGSQGRSEYSGRESGAPFSQERSDSQERSNGGRYGGSSDTRDGGRFATSRESRYGGSDENRYRGSDDGRYGGMSDERDSWQRSMQDPRAPFGAERDGDYEGRGQRQSRRDFNEPYGGNRSGRQSGASSNQPFRSEERFGGSESRGGSWTGGRDSTWSNAQDRSWSGGEMDGSAYGGSGSMGSRGNSGSRNSGSSQGQNGSSSGMQSEDRASFRGHGPKGYKRSDERIQEEVNDRLTDDMHIDASELECKVRNGEATLTGTVRDRETKRRVEELVESISGVSEVQNNLRVKKEGSKSSSGGTSASTNDPSSSSKDRPSSSTSTSTSGSSKSSH